MLSVVVALFSVGRGLASIVYGWMLDRKPPITPTSSGKHKVDVEALTKLAVEAEAEAETLRNRAALLLSLVIFLNADSNSGYAQVLPHRQKGVRDETKKRRQK